MMMTIIGMNLVSGEAKETIVMMNVVHVVVIDIKKKGRTETSVLP